MVASPGLHRPGGSVDLGAVLVGRTAGVVARTVTLSVGLGGGPLAALDAPAVVLNGAVLRTVALGRRAAALLHGPGDVLAASGDEPEPFAVRSRALTAGTVAILDADVMRAVAASPLLADRVAEVVSRQTELLVLQTILSQLTSIAERLAVLLPILAERWGTVSADGVLLPAFLSHSVLAELIGVRRPSLTTALADLTANGTLHRRDDRRWQLSPQLAGLAA